MTRNDITKSLESIKNDRVNELHTAWTSGDIKTCKIILHSIRRIFNEMENQIKKDLFDAL